MKWEWYQDGNTTRLFLHLLLTANHEMKRWRGMEIQRGQLVTGRFALSKQLNISEQSIRTSLERLKSTSEITTKSTNRFSIITITNYDSYNDRYLEANQPANQPANQQLTSNQPATNHKQEDKELKNVKKYKNRGVFSKPTVSEIKQYCQERNNSIDAEKFFHYYKSNGWKVGKVSMSDWKSAVITWEKRNGSQESKRDIVAELDEFEREIKEKENANKRAV